MQRSVPFFDEIAEDWAGQYDAPTAAGHALRERRRRVLELLGGLEGKVLDVGCGSAVLADDLVRRGWRYTGVDGSAPMVHTAGLRLAAVADARLEVADVAALPFPDATFDAVLCIGVLDRVADQGAAVRELVRVVRPGGRVVVSFANRYSPYAWWNSEVFRPAVGHTKRLLSRTGGSGADLASGAILHSPRTAQTLLDAAGAAPEEVVHYHLNVLLSPLDELFPRLAERLARRLESLHQSRGRWLGVGFLVAADRAGGPR